MKSENSKNIKERVMERIAKAIDIDLDSKSATEESEFIKDLGADSLDLVELIMAIEEEFGLEIPDDEAEKLKTIGDVVSYIQNALNAKAEA